MCFLAAVAAALEHECAHAFAARRVGFCLNKVVLMPYGAVLKGDLSGISPKDEIYVCLAGPLVNAFTALGFVALWWLIPETYPYTETAATVSLSLFLCNLLPAYPLDGGRVLAVLLRPLGKKRAHVIRHAVCGLIAAAIVVYFLVGCFSAPRYDVLFFALCLVCGGFGGGEYRHLTFSRRKSFARGVEERRVAISADCTLAAAIRFLRADRYLVLILFRGEEFVGELPEEELIAMLAAGDYSRLLGESCEFCQKTLEKTEELCYNNITEEKSSDQL